MEDLKKLKEALDAPIETRILPQKNFPYVPISALRERLNSAFDCLWDIEILSSEVVENNVLLHGKLIGHIGDKTISKEAYGSAPIHRFNSGVNKGQPTNIGDAYNNALYDFLKCASKLLCISNKEMDVKKDLKTGKYVRVDGIKSSMPDNVIPITQKQETPKVEISEEKINELKKKLEANKNKANEQPAIEPKPELKEPVVEKEDDVPMPEGSSVKEQESVPEETTDGVDTQQAKLLELRKKLLEANKKKVEPAVPKPESVEKKLVEVPTSKSTEENIESVGDYGFDYEDVGGGGGTAPKNTQKLVILNLAKMQKLTVEDYIKKALGKEKTVDELTVEEAGRVVRAGLSSFE